MEIYTYVVATSPRSGKENRVPQQVHDPLDMQQFAEYEMGWPCRIERTVIVDGVERVATEDDFKTHAAWVAEWNAAEEERW